jgi:mono/diheme cytochrome c family protein
MKKYLLIASVVGTAILTGCGAGKDPGYAYMPDMYYGTAYETYAPTTALQNDSVNYTGLPVAGAIARGQNLSLTYNLKFDSTGYAQSANLKNPLDSAGATTDLKEAERLYLINCGICHGAKLDGNGPLFNGGNGPFTAAPRNFMTDPVVLNMAPGTMFYSVTFGIRTMGSYASQLTPIQRWEVISYIKSKQKGAVATVVAGAAK